MDCTTCGPTPARADRPHTFLAHEHGRCPDCATEVEGRAVLRDGKAVLLMRCPKCGPRESLLADDGQKWLDAFLSRGAKDGLFKTTTSTCPSCLALVKANVVIAAGKVFFEKNCSTCGPSAALVSEDAGYYVRA